LKIYFPTVMLGLLIGGEQVGWFGSAHRIVLALHAFIWMYYFNLYPSISRCTQHTPETLQTLVGKSLQVNSWVAVFIGVTGTIFAKPLIYLVYGPQYTQAAIGFQFLIWLPAFVLISGHYMYILIAYNKQWLELFSAVSGAFVCIVLNLLLIPKFGFIGAAWAVLCSEAFIWTMYYYFVRREVALVRFSPHLVKPLVVGGIMAAVIHLAPTPNLIVSWGVAITLYGIGLLIFQPSMISDIRTLIFGNR